METIQQKLAHMCGVATSELSDITILKRSVDARKKPEVWMVYALAFLAGKKEGEILKRLQKRKVNCSRYEKPSFHLPKAKGPMHPVVIGAGPAGLFAAYAFANAG